MVFQGCSNGVSREFQYCFQNVFRLLQTKPKLFKPYQTLKPKSFQRGSFQTLGINILVCPNNICKLCHIISFWSNSESLYILACLGLTNGSVLNFIQINVIINVYAHKYGNWCYPSYNCNKPGTVIKINNADFYL